MSGCILGISTIMKWDFNSGAGIHSFVVLSVHASFCTCTTIMALLAVVITVCIAFANLDSGKHGNRHALNVFSDWQ